MIRARVRIRLDPEYNESRAGFATRELWLGKHRRRGGSGARAEPGGTGWRAGRAPLDHRFSRRSAGQGPASAAGVVGMAPRSPTGKLMTRWQRSTRPFLIGLPLLTLPAAGSAQAVDTSGAGAIITQAMDHSEVMANLRE